MRRKQSPSKINARLIATVKCNSECMFDLPPFLRRVKIIHSLKTNSLAPRGIEFAKIGVTYSSKDVFVTNLTTDRISLFSTGGSL